MIELLLSYNVDTGEALLHAIDEEFVEGRPVDQRSSPLHPFLFNLPILVISGGTTPSSRRSETATFEA